MIVDDSRNFRHGLALRLKEESWIQVVGLASDGVEAVELAAKLRPDVILMDHRMPRRTGAEATAEIRRWQDAPRVVMIAADPDVRDKARMAGADGFFLKDEPLGNVVAALRKAYGPRPARTLQPRGKTGPTTLGGIFWPILLAGLGLFLLAGIALFRGSFLPGLSLALGFFFFLYALKYYLAVGLVLIASGGNGNGDGNGNGHGNGHNGDGHKNGNGKAKKNGLRPYANGNGRAVWTKRQPFISIHLPVYNEKQVVERLLRACTSLEYENYEVLVADDSTDQTTQILRQGWGAHPRVRISHRSNRVGFKGGALREVLAKSDPRTEFVVVFDADFIPPPDILQQFLAYFYGANGNGNGDELRLLDPSVAVVQGYQWHVLNASENWITRGVRTEFSGSYVVERAGQQLASGMKMISGSVFMIRADVLRQHGWSTSITEDWELTLRLYLDGWKVLYTPFVQAPAECVSNFKQLTRQRMRWAEGHTFNVKKYFGRVMGSHKIGFMEKLEFIYFAPYYLQSAVFMLGTAAWFISELLLRQHLALWSETLGWSLVFANAFSLLLMNLAGLFLERGVKRNWGGLLSFILLTYLLVPFQAYASLKGLLEAREGGWHRTQKTGLITEVIDRYGLGRKMRRLLPKKKKRPVDLGRRLGVAAFNATGVGRAVAGLIIGGVLGVILWSGLPDDQPAGLGLMLGIGSIPLLMAILSAPRRLAWRVVSILAAGLIALGILGSQAMPAMAGRNLVVGETTPTFWFYDDTTPQTYMMYQSQPSGANTNSPSPTFYSDTFPEGWSIQSGTTTVYAYGGNSTPNDTTFTVTLSAGSGSTWTQLGTTTLDILSFSPVSLLSLSFSTSSYTYGSAEQLRLMFTPDISGARIYWDGSYNNSRLALPGVVVPETAQALMIAVLALPFLASGFWRRQRLSMPLSLMATFLVLMGMLAGQVAPARAAPDIFNFHNTSTSGITPAGLYMNTSANSGSSTMLFDSTDDAAYWYVDETWPQGSDNASIAAGPYTANLYFDSLPSGGGSAPAASGTVSTGDARPRTLTLSHTTSGSDRLMLVGVSILNTGSETVLNPNGITYNGDTLTRLSSVQAGSRGRVEIWYLYGPSGPDTGTHDVVVTFDDGAGGGLRSSAVVGVMTFTGVNQTTPFGTAVTNFDNATPFGTPTVDVTSAANELVFDTVVCEACTSLTVGASQTQRWNLTETSGGPTNIGAGSTEAGAASVTMSWTQGTGNFWAIAAVPIKPSGGSAPAVDSVSTGQTQRTSMTISHTTPVAGTNRLMLVGVALNNNQSETVSSITYNGASLTSVGSAQQSTDVRVEIWRLVAPDTGTHDVVITFSASLRYGAQAGVITFTGVDQSTPLGTYQGANGSSTGPATVNVSSATNELVFDTVGCQGDAIPTLCASLSVGAGQSQRWNLATNNAGTAGEQTRSGASTEPGASSVTMSWSISTGGDVPWAIVAVPIRPVSTASVDITVYVHHTDADGSAETLITSASTTITSGTANPLALNLGSGAYQEYLASDPQRLRVYIDVTGVSGSGSFTLAYDSTTDPSGLETPAITVPDMNLLFLVLVPFIPLLTSVIWRRRRLAWQIISALVAVSLAMGMAGTTVEVVHANPDQYFLRDITQSGALQMTRGSGGTYETWQDITTTGYRYWYSSELYPTGNDPASVASGTWSLSFWYKRRGGPSSNITMTIQVLWCPDAGCTGSETPFAESSSWTSSSVNTPTEVSVQICASCSQQTITSDARRRMVVRLNVTAVAGSGASFYYNNSDGAEGDTQLTTPVVTVPESALALLPAVLAIPALARAARRRKVSRVGRPSRLEKVDW